MGWFCPTFQRPERLAELALSWERCQKGTPLHVRVWSEDPRREDYFKYDWPEDWHLYVSGAEWAGEALNQYYDWNPNEPFYGFIGDDVVLRTKNGLEVLEVAAGKMFMSYPNDTVWRHQLSTHFCLGGDTARAMGSVIPRRFYHYHMDRALMFVMRDCGLQRYCPQVIFHHKHFMMECADLDVTYQKAYGITTMEELNALTEPPHEQEYLEWAKSEEAKELILGLRKKLVQQYERPREWEEQDFEAMREAYEDESVLCDKTE